MPSYRKSEVGKKAINGVPSKNTDEYHGEGACCSKDIISHANNNDEGSKQQMPIVKLTAPSPGDVDRKFIDAELIDLCKRVPCRVNMSKWNTVRDTEKRPNSEGAKEGKADEAFKQILLKEIKEENIVRKKTNIGRLHLWKSQRRHRISGNADSSDDSSDSEL